MSRDFDYRAAAHRAIDALFDSPAVMRAIQKEHAAEANRLSGMRTRRRDAGKSSHLTSGDLKYTEQHFPALHSMDVWRLVVRGSDLQAGSVQAGYELRHGEEAMT